MIPSEGFVETNSLSPPPAESIRLHYLEWGGDGPPAVLLHATGFLARLWQPIAEALSERFHVYAYDARGHGDSDKPASDYGWDRLVDDLMGFLNALGLRRTLAIGHSMGGASVAYLAATEPEYISSAVLIEPIIFPPPVDGGNDRLVAGAARRRMVWPSPEELIRSYRARPTFTNWREDILRLYAEHGTFRREDGQFELKCPGQIEAQVFQNSFSLDTRRLLPEIRCPTLVLHGQHTEHGLVLAARGIAEAIPDAHLVAIAGAGHLVPMEHPGAVSAEITAFLDQEAAPE